MVTQAITAQVKFFMHFFALAVPYILVFIYLHGDFEVYFIILFIFSHVLVWVSVHIK